MTQRLPLRRRNDRSAGAGMIDASTSVRPVAPAVFLRNQSLNRRPGHPCPNSVNTSDALEGWPAAPIGDLSAGCPVTTSLYSSSIGDGG